MNLIISTATYNQTYFFLFLQMGAPLKNIYHNLLLFNNNAKEEAATKIINETTVYCSQNNKANIELKYTVLHRTTLKNKIMKLYTLS